jgi:UDP-N-acetylglucosamine 1-carboxyvinyltransferase
MPAVQFVVEGGRPLSGSIRPSGNKNAALPIVAAAIISPNKVHLENVPRIRDIETLVELIRSVGASMEWVGRNSLEVLATDLRPADLNPTLCAKIRASILLAAPLLARCGQVTLPPPGGDVIGRRRLDTHFLALEQLGAKFTHGKMIEMRVNGFKGADVFLDEPSVTATENALLCSVIAPGRTVIRNAASEPHVQELAMALVQMGARVHGIGTNTLEVRGVPELHGVDHVIWSDHMEVGSFMGLAAMTHGELTVQRCAPQHLAMIRAVFKRLGIDSSIDGDELHVPAKAAYVIEQDLGGKIPTIKSQLWPGFPSDLISIATAFATQAEGTVLMHEWMFDGRMFWLGSLESFGARLVLADPHRAVIMGPSQLYGTEVQSPDIRAGLALVGAALCAKGTSVINNIEQIDRGYEDVDGRLRGLGAKIERVA